MSRFLLALITAATARELAGGEINRRRFRDASVLATLNLEEPIPRQSGRHMCDKEGSGFRYHCPFLPKIVRVQLQDKLAVLLEECVTGIAPRPVCATLKEVLDCAVGVNLALTRHFRPHLVHCGGQIGIISSCLGYCNEQSGKCRGIPGVLEPIFGERIDDPLHRHTLGDLMLLSRFTRHVCRVTALHIPFELLKARREAENAWQPRVDELLVLLIKLTVLADEIDLPLGKLLLLIPRIWGKRLTNLLRGETAELLSERSTIAAKLLKARGKRCAVLVGIRRAKLHRPHRE